jgi:hypothetical protein
MSQSSDIPAFYTSSTAARPFLYSETLRSWHFRYVPDQIYLYLASYASVRIVSKEAWRYWNLGLAQQAVVRGITDADSVFFYRAGVDQSFPEAAMQCRNQFLAHAVMKAIGIVGICCLCIQVENRGWFPPERLGL